MHVDKGMRARAQVDRIGFRNADVGAEARIRLPVLEDVCRVEGRAVAGREDEVRAVHTSVPTVTSTHEGDRRCSRPS